MVKSKRHDDVLMIRSVSMLMAMLFSRMSVGTLATNTRVVATTRTLQEQQNSTQQCNICLPGFSLLNNTVPIKTEAAARISFDSQADKAMLLQEDNNFTCADWEAYATRNKEKFDCLALRDWLFRQCCGDDVPPFYECEANMREALLSGRYDKFIPPITKGIAVDVDLVVELFDDMKIVDHGMDGGAIEILGSLHLQWTDERLRWNTSFEMPCTSCEVRSTDLWTPNLVPHNQGTTTEALADTTAVVLPNGNIYWSRHGTMLFHCRTESNDDAKLCSIQLVDDSADQGGHVNFVLRDMIINNPLGIPEYRLNENTSVLDEETIQSQGVTIQEVNLQLDFLPLSEDCNICGATEAKLVNGTIRAYPEEWLEYYPNTHGWSCSDLDALLILQNVSSYVCEIGRAFFEEACCDDTRSTYECESQIHDALVEKYNTITPVDPSPKEEDPFFHSKDAVDVQISLDISHALEIDVKTNSMQILVSLELEWYDPRLVWEPFIGGCHRFTCRASIDAELTDLWVPNVELVNMVQGVQSLPEAHASVRYDGYVSWRRTGVLTAICDLSGIENFPFDKTECHMEFGGTMDPLFHRVNYVPANKSVEYSERVSDSSWNFQEYKLEPSETKVSFRTEQLSGFENKLVRFEFTFSRAKRYYVFLFVVLYIIFTYLAFGMFFVDFHLGERLGYGSSILFVIVAQDITLSESTPVTQEFLWIYRLSFGSKMFVVFGIVESIIVLYYYSHGDYEDGNEGHGDIEETRCLIGDNNNNNSLESSSRDENDDERQIVAVDAEMNESSHLESSVQPCNERKCSRRRKLMKSLTWLSHKVLPHGIDESDSRKKRRMKKLRTVDYTSAIIFFVTYSIFLLVMFLLATA